MRFMSSPPENAGTCSRWLSPRQKVVTLQYLAACSYRLGKVMVASTWIEKAEVELLKVDDPRLGGDGDDVGDGAEGDPGLGAVEYVAAVVGRGRGGGDGRGVGSGGRFGHGEGADRLAAGHRREPAGLLFG